MEIKTRFQSLIIVINLCHIHLFNAENDAINGNFTCGQKWSCEQYSNTSSRQQSVDLNEVTCRCDALCVLFKDCCHDAIPTPSNVTRMLDGMSPDSVSCSSIKELNKTQVYIVKECPPTWSGQLVRSLCENSNDTDVLLRLPVTGIETRIMTYKNLYCAICHQINYTYWIPSVSCTERPPNVTSLTNITIQDAAQYSGCSIRFLPPSDDTNYRSCLDMIEKCHPNYNDTRVIELCENMDVMQMVYSRSKVWKNIHCAVCNYENNISCTSLSRSPSPVPTRQGINVFYSFSILLDLNTGSGSTTIETSSTTETRKRTEVYTCKHGELYDPFISSCRTVSCEDSMIYADGRCQEIQSSGNLSISDCTRIELNETEYVLIDNDTLLELSSGKLFDKTEYYVRGNLAFVCSNLTENYTKTTFVDELVVIATFSQIQGIVSFTGLTVSLLALLVTIVIYSAIESLRNTPGKNLLSLCCSLFVAESLMLAAPFAHDVAVLCKGVAICMHYFFLVAFCWMNVIAADVWTAFSKSFIQTETTGKSLNRFCFYSMYAWTVPALILAASLLVNYLPVESSLKPDYGKGICWLANQNSLLVFFAVPLFIIIAMNTIFFVITSINICKRRMSARKYLEHKDTVNFPIYLRLFVIIGLTWIMGFLAILISHPVLWYMFAVLNTMQGFLISVTFVTTRKVLRLVKERLLGSRQNSQHSSIEPSSSKRTLSESVSTIENTV